MGRFRYIAILMALLLAVLLLPTSTVAQTATVAQGATTVGDTEHLQHYAYFFLEGVKQQEQGHYAAAFDLFRHARDLNPDAAEVYFQLAGYYVDLKMTDKVRECFERAVALSPKNDTYQERLAQFFITQQEYSKAITTYENLYSNHRDRDDVLRLLFRLYATQNDYSQMIHTLDRMELIEGTSEQLTFTKIQLYEQKGEKNKVMHELKQLISAHPHDLNYRVMLGNWQLQNDNPEAALKEYKAVLKEEPDNHLAQVSMLDYYKAKKQYGKVDALLSSILQNNHVESETKLILLRQLIYEYQQGETDSIRVFHFIDEALQQPQANGDFYLLKAGYESLLDMPQDSINTLYRQTLDIEPDNAMARLLLIEDMWKTENYDEVIRLCRPARQYNPEEMRFYYFQGLAHYQKNEKNEALETFRMGVSQINNDSEPDIVSDFYELMGDILHDKGLDKEAFAAYDSCLQWKPDNIGCLNNYAYYLAIKGGSLTKAEQMSYKTVKAEPQNATFLDTYAWILHLQGREEEAKIYMEETLRYDEDPSEEVQQHAEAILQQPYEEIKKAKSQNKEYDEKNNDSSRDHLGTGSMRNEADSTEQ